MREKLLNIFKIGILVVLIGFLCPVSCNMNGIDLIRTASSKTGTVGPVAISFVLILLFSILALFYGMSSEKKTETCWLLFLPNFLSAGFMLFYYREGIKIGTVILNFGTYIMIAGYILSLVFLICASFCKNQKDEIPLAEKIALFCLKRKIEPARKKGKKEIEIFAKDVHEKMRLSNMLSAVCNVLSETRFLEMANVKIINEEGKKYSAEYSVVYEIL